MVTRFIRVGSVSFVLLAALLLPVSASAQAILSVSPTSFSRQGYTGTNLSSDFVQVKNAGSRALKWSVVAPTASWLTVSPTAGTNSGTLTLTYKTSALTAGTFQTTFRVQTNTGTSATVSVQISLATPPAPAPPKLVVSCPAYISVASSNSSGVVVNYSATTSGGVAPVTMTGNPASGSSFPVGTTPVLVSAGSADGQTASCGFTVTVTYSAPATLGVSCPANMSVASSGGSAVVVSYSATTSGGVAPVTVSGNPASGSSFPVGTTPVLVTARSSDGQTASCGFSVTVTYSPISPTAVGPQSAITCPAGAVDIFPGIDIQGIVNLYAGNTTFCLRAGIHYRTSAITPKTGNTFVGEYGAILDGTGWVTSDDTQAAFRAHNQDIDYVTIRNLVIRNMPERGIHAFYYMSDHWTIEYTEITACANAALVIPPYTMVRNNYIHHNPFAGYMGPYAHYSTFDSNEIAYNGNEQKLGETTNVTFRNNFIHHTTGGAGIWFDSHNTGALVEGNRVEDNGWFGIFYEISSNAIIRNNTIRRNAEAGIMLSVSQNVQIYGNTIDSNFRGITYYLNCPSMSDTAVDLANNTAHDNAITVGTQSGAFASLVGYGNCTATQVAPYLNGSKNLTFSSNTYRVPSSSGRYWLWGVDTKLWTDWQALGQDVTGTMSQ